MFILINDNGEIVAYADYGSIEGSIEFGGSVPDDFEANFKPNFYLLQNNEIVVNQNYKEPTVDIPEPQPSAEQQAITDLAINSAEHDQHIQSIEEAITALAQSQGGTN